MPLDDPPATDPGEEVAVAKMPKPGLRDAAAAFRYRNFTLFWTGALLSNSGTWVQNVTIPFVVYQLTGSALWLGFTGFMQFIPIVVMGPLGGSLADRFDRRSVLLATQSAQAVVALALWGCWITDHQSAAVIIPLVTVSGLITGINIPSWQAFVSELVPRDVLLNAVTLNSTQFNAARAFGPALGGLVLATLGVASAFLINAISFLAVIGALLLIHVPRVPKRTGPRPTVLGELSDAFRYSRARHGILACFVVVVAVGGLGSPMVQLFVVFAHEVFGVGDLAYGFLGAALGIGSILAAPLIAGRGSSVPRSRLVDISMLVYGLSVVAFGLAPVYVVGFIALLFAGAGYLAMASTLNTTIQMQVHEVMRGKVLAVYIMFLTASLPIGIFVQGAVAHWIGPRAAVAGAGVLLLAVIAWLRFGTDWVQHMDDAGPLDDDLEGAVSQP